VAHERCGLRLYTPAARHGLARLSAASVRTGQGKRTGSGGATRAAQGFRARVEVGRAEKRRARGSISPGKHLHSMTTIRVVADCTLPYRGRCAVPFYGLSFCWHFLFKLNLRQASPHFKRNLRL
jgi:hypothetical protein